MAGRASIGSFVLVNAMLVQLYIPLNFMGMLYREIKQALIDIDDMFSILERNPEIEDRPGAKPLAVSGGRACASRTCTSPTCRSARSSRASASRCRPGRRRHRRPVRRRQVDDLAAPVPLLRADERPHPDRRPGHRRGARRRRLRAAIGMVPQDTVLFNDTIGYNVQYGRWDASTDEVREAARLAQIDRFIAHPAGRLRDLGRRARAEALGRREAARRDRPHHPQGPADPGPRRGHLGARFVHREGDPGRARPGQPRPHDARHRAPPLDRDRRRRDHRARQGRASSSAAPTRSLLARGGVYAAMWNRQREAEEAREALKRAEEEEAPVWLSLRADGSPVVRRG